MSEKLKRHTEPEERERLKFSVRAALRAVRQNAFALVTRGEEGTLTKYGGDMHPDLHMPIDVLADLEREHMAKFNLPSPVLQCLAGMVGMKLVPCDDDSDGATAIDHAVLKRVIKEGGEAESATVDALGATDLETVRRARKECAEARQAWTFAEHSAMRQERRLLRREG